MKVVLRREKAKDVRVELAPGRRELAESPHIAIAAVVSLPRAQGACSHTSSVNPSVRRVCPGRRELAPERRPAFVDLNSLPLAGARHPWVGHGYCITSPRHIPECSAMARFRRDAFSAGRQWQDIGRKLPQAIIRGKIFTSCIRKGSSGGNIAPSWQHIDAMYPK